MSAPPKKRHLEAVQGEAAPDAWFAADAQALLTKALADKPTALVMLWEAETGIMRGAVPRSDTLIAGMVGLIYEAMNAEDGE